MVSKKPIFCKVIVTILVCATAMLVQAEDYQLETIVVTGRPAASAVNDVAGSVAVLDRDVLELVQPSHIAEVADRVPGVWISRGNGQEHLTAIRSPVLTGPGSCGAFVVLEDGIPTRPAGFCNVNQLFEINSEQADRIEIYKGPNSAVYGSNAVHGVINVISPGISTSEQTSVMLDGGPHDYARAFLSYSDGDNIRINAHTDHDGGYKDASGFDQQKINVKSVLRDDDRRVENFVEVTNLNQETASYIDGDGAYKDDSRKDDNPNPEAFRDAQSAHAYSKWIVHAGEENEFQITPYANMSQMEFLQHFIRGTPLEKNGHESVGVNGRFNYPLALLPDARVSAVSGFNIETGRAYIDQFQENPVLPPNPLFPPGQHYDFDVLMSSLGLFSELHYELNPATTVLAGVRYDHQFYDYHNKALPIVGSLYTPLPSRDDEFGDWGINAGLLLRMAEQHHGYVNLSRGFRIPQIAEVYRLQGAPPDQQVDAEHIDNIEVGLRGHLKPFYGENLVYDIAVFNMEKSDVILQDSNRQYLGNGTTQHRGLELSLDYLLTAHFYINTALTYAEHRYDDIERPLFPLSGNVDGNIIDTAPRHIGSLQLGRHFARGLLELEIKHMGSYYLDPEHDWEYEGHNLLNLRALWQVQDDIRITARLLNLNNIDYAERADVRPATFFLAEAPRYFVGEPRSLYVSIEKTFY